MRRLFGKLKDLSFDKGAVTMHWMDKTTSTVPLIWLRDNPQTGPRTSLPTSLKLQTITLDEGKNTLIIKWTDRPADAYTGPWLHQALAVPPVSPPIEKEPLGVENLVKVKLAADYGVKEGIESIERYGAVVIGGHREILEVLEKADMRVVSRGGGMRTEGVYLKEVPKLIVVKVDVSTTIQLLDSLLLSSLPWFAPLLPLLSQFPASYQHSSPPLLYRSTHPLCSQSPLSVVYNQLYRDFRVEDKQFYALLGHFQHALAQLNPVDLTLAPGETLLIDNHRILASWQPATDVISAFSSSMYEALLPGRESK